MAEARSDGIAYRTRTERQAEGEGWSGSQGMNEVRAGAPGAMENRFSDETRCGVLLRLIMAHDPPTLTNRPEPSFSQRRLRGQ